MSDIDILLINIPWWDMSTPPLAPALLKGIVESEGFKAKTHDFNVDLLEKFFNNDRKKYADLEMYFSVGSSNANISNLINDFYQYIIDQINKYNFKYLGISVFSVHTHRATLELCTKIKEQYPDIKIVVGGRGLVAKCNISIFNSITSAEKMIPFSDVLKKKKLVHTVITGDGEDAIVDFLRNEESIVDQQYIVEKNKLDYPFSNFDDYKLDSYVMVGNKQLPVISSKGCVRDCDFCDVRSQFKKYKSKDGARLAQEMIHLATKYQIYEFHMADSIANGNIKELKKTCEILKQYNQKHDNKITWACNWIARMPNSLKPSMYDLLKDSGLVSVAIGAESGSNEVLEAMNKKSSVEGLYYDIEHFHRLGINIILNNIISHWSEKYQNFKEHVDMLLTIGPYIANKTITELVINNGFVLLDDTPAAKNFKADLVSEGGNFSHIWYSKSNPSLTMKARLARWFFVVKMCRYLGYSVKSPQLFSEIALNITNDKDKLFHFYKKHVDKNAYFECPSIMDINHVEEIIDSSIRKKFKKSKLYLRINSQSVNGSPTFKITINNEVLFEQIVDDGVHELSFEFENNFNKENQITFEMFGKAQYDTEVDSDGNIIKDKRIILESVVIDKVDLIKNTEYFYKKLKYFENEKEAEVKPGFWSNAKLQINFNSCFWKDYLSKTYDKITWRQTIEDIDSRVDTNLELIKSKLEKFEY